MDDIDHGEHAVSFIPPLWVQRQDFLRKFIFSNNIEEVCDLGCGSAKLLNDLIRVGSMRRLVGLDIDKEVLSEALEKVCPTVSDYYIKRRHPMSAKFIVGSALVPTELVPRQLQCVICSEVIEHIDLYSEVPQLTHNIFGYINPRYAVITTPNRDFNVYFNNKGVRIPDHKFEWTQEEFKQWASDTCRRYGYSVEFTGCGIEEGCDRHGFCTQIAVFHRIDMNFEDFEVGYDMHTVVSSFEIDASKTENFMEKFKNAIYYSYSNSLQTNDAEYGDPIDLTDLYRYPSVVVLCDGSFNRLTDLLKLVQDPKIVFSEDDNTVTINDDQEDSEDADEYSGSDLEYFDDHFD